MNLIEFKTFLTVIEEKGITAAAEKLNITQPAVSKRLENLKNAFGIDTLFTRVSGGLTVSKNAQILIPYAKNIIALAENARNEVNNFKQGTKGKIFIGAGASWTLSFLPKAISKTLESFPDLVVDLNVDLPDLQVKKLQDNKIDILFARKPQNEEFFYFEPLKVDKFIVMASRKHPLANKKISLKELTNYKWAISTTAKQTQELFFNFFSSKDLPSPTISFSTNSLNVALNSLLNSTLLLFTTHNTLEIFQSEKFCKIEISDFDVSRETGLIIRQGYTSNFLNTLIKNLKKMMKEEN
jgi:DNA-binding transcriptional LysR family regulator